MKQLTWRMDADTMGLAALAAGDAAAFLSGVNPSLFTIRTFTNTWGTSGDIRRGMVIANAMAIGVAYGTTLIAGSWWPLAITVATCAVLDSAYEWALRNPRNAES